jgi:hypothetical protein
MPHSGALEQWYLDGGIHPIAQYVEEGLRPGGLARGSYGVDAAFMQLKRHERGIHAVSCGVGGPGTGRGWGWRGSGWCWGAVVGRSGRMARRRPAIR